MQCPTRRQSALGWRTGSPRRPLHEYRVLALRRQEVPEVVWLTNDRRYAIELAEQLGAVLVKQWRAERGLSDGGVRSVRVERWTGDGAQGQWKEIWPEAANSAANAKAKRQERFSKRLPGLPKSGNLVQCVLLAEKTRRGGWRARLVKLGLDGPITNHENVPSDAAPNQSVTLRIGAVSDDGRHLQFVWQPHVSGDEGRP